MKSRTARFRVNYHNHFYLAVLRVIGAYQDD